MPAAPDRPPARPLPLPADDRGSGPAAVFLHGYLLDRSFWTPLLEAMGPVGRTLALDLPGFGAAPPLPAGAPPSLEAMADAVVATLDARGIERAAVVGLSMGGYVALALWARHPSRVRALALCDTRATADSPAVRARRDAMVQVARAEGAQAAAMAMMPGIIGATTQATRPAVTAGALALMGRQPVAGIVDALAAMRDRPDRTALLAGITVPTLCLVGAEDALTTPEEMRAMAGAIPGAVLVEVPGVGHLAPWEDAASVAPVVAGFLRGVGGAEVGD
jgi:pimeloyl-ACP methyl ester carboxylesterase